MNENIAKALRRGEIVQVGKKLYGICADCGSLVQLNKRIFGSAHICDPR